MINTLTIRSPAKINLCLCVTGRRDDGYHEVEMLMQMVGLYDEVTVRTGGERISVTCTSGSVPEGQGNIAWRAAAEMIAATGSRTGVSIEIRKSIPVAAGLGGGSGNAAAVLAGLNRLLGAGMDRDRLSAIGMRLGMDVPFFFHGPTALARGRGEVLTPLAPLPPCWVLLVNPGFETSTAWAYKNLNLRLTKKVDCNKISRLQLQKVAQGLHNDLESVTIAANPVIERIKDALISLGALGALMSGSGPTVFGMFESEQACRSAADGLSQEGWNLYPVETLTGSPLDIDDRGSNRP